jgi:lysophospholipase L1-like esterase
MKSLLLFLSFAAACASNMSAAPEEQAVHTRVILVGDSTVAPRGGWGDAFAKLLAPGVECRNLALGGRSSKSYRDEGHWKKVLEAKPDWVFIQFGHNDQSGGTGNDGLAEYVAATRAVAATEKIPLIDLNARSIALMNEIGPEAAVSYDLKKGDTTHLSPVGAEKTAALVAAEIWEKAGDLAAILKK